MIDYHIHTPLCNHAVGEMGEYVEAALKKGLSEICFLDHLIISGRGQKNSMAIEDIHDYYDDIQRVKALYSDRINVRSGLEVDFDPENIQRLEKILKQFPFDVIGSSVHFVNGVNIASRREASVSSASEEKTLVRRYFESLRQMLNFGYFDIICHFDIVKKTGRVISEEFSAEIEDILSVVAKKKLAIELNTSGWDHPAGACYPSEGVIQKCVAAGIPFVLSSDAHKPEEVGRYFDRAAQILLSAGCQRVCIFENRKRRFIEIK